MVPDSGHVYLDGEQVQFTSPNEARKRGIETVYQTLAVAPALGIAINLFLGREIRREGFLAALRFLDKKAMRTEAKSQLESLGDMPAIFEVADRIHVHRLGRRVGVVDPKEITVADAVAFITGAFGDPLRR